MNPRFIDAVLDHPRRVYISVLLVVSLLGALIPLINIDTDPENMLPANNPIRVLHNQVKQQFALSDTIVVGLVGEQGIYNVPVLTTLHQLTELALSLDGVVTQDLMSLSVVDNITQAGPGTLRFEWMMPQPPENQAQAEVIRRAVERLPMLHNTLVSADGKAAAIYVPIVDKNQSYSIAEQLRTGFAELQAPAGLEFYITGLPVAEDQFGYEMFVQMGISAPLAGAMIFLLLWLFFRNLALIVPAMLVAMGTVLATMGLMIGLGYTVHIMSSMIAIFLMPIAVVDSVHILSEFADDYKQGRDVREVIRDVVGKLFTPMLYTSLTSAVGFLSLLLTPIPPVQIFGAFVAFGILLAFVLTITLLPAYIVRMSPQNLAALQRLEVKHGEHGALARALRPLGGFATRRPRWLLIGFTLLAAFSVVGISRIQINDNPMNWFKSDHELRVADRALNSHFAGTYDAYLVLSATDERLQQLVVQTNQLAESLGVSGWQALSLDVDQSLDEQLQQRIQWADDALFNAEGLELQALDALLGQLEQAQMDSRVFLSPAVLGWMVRLANELDQSGLVGKSNSLPQLVKTVNRELQGGAAGDYKLPASHFGVAQTLLQYQSSHRPQDLWHFVTPDYRRALMWLQLVSGDNQHMSAVVERVNQFVETDPLPDGLQLDWAGKAYLNVIWQDAMVKGMGESIFSAALVVLIMMVILFRSFSFALLAMLPLTLTIMAIYGVIGWIGKDYDMPIAVLSSLAIGLSVDFAIHFVQRTRAIYGDTGLLSDTLRLMFEEPGRAIARNALVIAIGFTPLLLAPLTPYVTVGMILASIMALSALITLVLLPALMQLARHSLFSTKRLDAVEEKA